MLPKRRENKGNEDGDSSDASGTVVNVGRYFQTEEDDKARCTLCEALTDIRRLKQHLTRRHPWVMAALIAQDTDDDDDKVSAGALRKDPLNSSTTLLVVKSEADHSKKHKNVAAPQDSNSDEEVPLKKKRKDTNSTQDTFLQYIATLLRDVPQELYLQLQMDIVNVIMKARIGHEKMSLSRSSVASSEHQRLGTSNGESGISESKVNHIVDTAPSDAE